MQQDPIRITIVSPSDVPAERLAAARVVEEVSRVLVLQGQPSVESWRWEVDSHPGFHALGPQGLIDGLMRIEDVDVVVGIFWTRFGTPTASHRSGTEHELTKAIESFRRTGRPQVMVYFCSGPAAATTTSQIDQWRAVLDFKERFPPEGLWWSYSDAEDFERQFRAHLQTHLYTSNIVPTSVTKGDGDSLLEPPTPSAAVARPEATAALAGALVAHPVVVLGGLPGSGKTYLAADLLIGADAPTRYSKVLWHDPAPGESVDALLAIVGGLLEIPGESTVSRCKGLAGQLKKRNYVLVIDNYQVVDQSSYSTLLSSVTALADSGRLMLLSQTYVSALDVGTDPHHVSLAGLSMEECLDLLHKRGLTEIEDHVARELLRKTGGLPFAVALFSLLVLNFGHDPAELLAGDMESAYRIRAWFDRIFNVLDEDARSLLSRLALLDVPFNIGVMKAVARESAIVNPGPAFELLQKHFLVSKHTRYRWIVHQLLRLLASPMLTEERRAEVHGILGRHFLRGLPRNRTERLSPDQFHAKVLAFRHLSKSPNDLRLAHSILEELSGTAKALAHHALFLELSRPVLGAATITGHWLKYHHAHCALILGQTDYCIQVVEPMMSDDIVAGEPIMRLSFCRLAAEATGTGHQADASINSLRNAIESVSVELGDAADALPVRQAMSSLSWLLSRAGRHAEAAQLARELLALAQRKNDARGGAIAWARLGMAESGLGQIAQAIESLMAAIELFNLGNDRRGVAWATLELGECQLKAKAIEDAETELIRAFAISAELGEASLDFQECLTRILKLSPPPEICLLVLQEQQRIKQQLASQSALLGLSSRTEPLRG